MKLDMRSSTPEEQPAVKALLLRAFNAPSQALFAREDHLHWKYYRPREDWPGSRSFVCARESSLVAHACAWPFRLSVVGEAVDGSHPIDWAATSDVPGLGALLLRHMRTLSTVSCCIGGTDVAQKVIVQTGYKAIGEMKFYARPLHAFRQALTHQHRNWKLPARFFRNEIWSRTAGRQTAANWTANAIAPDDLPLAALPRSSPMVIACIRTPAQFAYLLECPVATYRLFLAAREGEPAGYFLLSVVPGQARLADVWCIRHQPEEWAALYGLAVHVASRLPGVAEITASATFDVAQRGLSLAGFRVSRTLPIMFFDPEKRLAQAPLPHLQMIDNDFSFLHSGRPHYET